MINFFLKYVNGMVFIKYQKSYNTSTSSGYRTLNFHINQTRISLFPKSDYFASKLDRWHGLVEYIALSFHPHYIIRLHDGRDDRGYINIYPWILRITLTSSYKWLVFYWEFFFLQIHIHILLQSIMTKDLINKFW